MAHRELKDVQEMLEVQLSQQLKQAKRKQI